MAASQLRPAWPDSGCQVTWAVKSHLVQVRQFLVGIWIPSLRPSMGTSACPCSCLQAVTSTATSMLQRCRRRLWFGTELLSQLSGRAALSKGLVQLLFTSGCMGMSCCWHCSKDGRISHGIHSKALLPPAHQQGGGFHYLSG